MFDFIRVASAVPLVKVADTEYNTDKIYEKLENAKEGKAQFVVFPELCISSYTCGDLFFQKKLLSSVKEKLMLITEKSKDYDFAVIVGAPLEMESKLFNCAFVIFKGKLCGINVKTFLPNYNEFYEKRWFSSSRDLQAYEIKSTDIGFDDNYAIPVGRNLIYDINGVKFGIELCEDLWTPLPPSTFLALGGAQIIFNLSGSNETIAKRGYRQELVRQQSARNICGYVYCSAGETESTTDLIFSGHSLIAENGAILKENEKLTDTDYIIFGDIDVGKITSDRLKNKSFADCCGVYGKLEPCRNIVCSGKVKDFTSDGEYIKIRKLPFVPSSKKDRLDRCMNIFSMQVAGLKKRTEVTNSKLVIGVSGGLDSTLALLVCTEAMRELGRPLTDITGITMPCFGTTDRTYNNAVKLMDTLGITSKEINIKDACVQHCKDIGHDINSFDVTFENVQARERTQVLMDYACRTNGFVVGTGDLSELALGWCTYNADHMSMYGVNASIPKTLIRWMIESIASFDVFEKSSDILLDIIDTPISPELLPPDEKGQIAQETESIVGPYALHDFFLFYMLRYGFAPDKIYHLAKKAFSDDFDSDTILKWIKVFYRRFFTHQFKRSCLPDCVKVGSICLSPRGDWRMPSDASAALWLDCIEKLK